MIIRNKQAINQRKGALSYHDIVARMTTMHVGITDVLSVCMSIRWPRSELATFANRNRDYVFEMKLNIFGMFLSCKYFF